MSICLTVLKSGCSGSHPLHVRFSSDTKGSRLERLFDSERMATDPSLIMCFIPLNKRNALIAHSVSTGDMMRFMSTVAFSV